MKLMNRLTVKNLTLNKKRTAVTIVGIMLSVALLLSVIGVFFSFRESIVNYVKATEGDYHLAIHGASKSEQKRISKNRNVERIDKTYGVGYAVLPAGTEETRPYLYVCGYSKGALEHLVYGLVRGRMPKNEDEIVVPEHIETFLDIPLKKAGLEVGDTITLSVGKRMNQGRVLTQEDGYEEGETLSETTERTYKVVGVVKRQADDFEPFDAPGFLAITYADQNSLKQAERVNLYLRYTKKGLNNFEVATAQIFGLDTMIFKNYLSKINVGLEAEEPEEIMNYEGFHLNEELLLLEGNVWKYPIFRGILYMVIIVCLVIIIASVFCIKNSFDISISEKIRQYGMLASIGATKKQIRRNVFFEAAILGGIGIAAGIMVGLGAARCLVWISRYYMKSLLADTQFSFRFAFSWEGLLATVLLGIITVYLSALKSSVKASKISPIIAIKNSENIKIKAKKLKTPKLIKLLFGIGGEISYKNLKRNKRRYRTTTVSITISVMMFIALFYAMSEIHHVIEKAFPLTSYNISLNIYGREYEEDFEEDVSDSDYEKTDHEENGRKPVVDKILSLEGIKDYAITDQFECYVSDTAWHKEYRELYEKRYDGGYSEEEDGKYLKVFCVGEKEYERYLKKLKLRYEDVWNKGILINQQTMYIMTDEGVEERTVKVFDLKKDNTIKSEITRYETTMENGDPVDEEIRMDLPEITIAQVTELRPMGLEEETDDAALIVSDAFFASLKKEYELRTSEEYMTEMYFNAPKADSLEKELRNLLNREHWQYSMVNREREAKNLENLYTLIGIFMYGFIAVISLIGLTNVFNTITTAMALRSREFATLKSVGMTKREFNRMIRLESLFMGAKSLFYGVLSGIGISYLMYRFLASGFIFKMDYEPPWKGVVMAIVTVMALIFAIMRYSLNKVNRQNVIETIRNENI